MTRPAPHRLLLLSLLAVLLLSVPAVASDQRGQHGQSNHHDHGDDAVTVMTRNMYFGADLTPALVAADQVSFVLAVTSIFATVNASDVANRVDRMAREIARTKPDLVGLQEVATWRTQFPPDFSPTPNATTVVYDFLKLLLADLAARGEHYVVVARHVTNDLEAPAFCPNTAPFTCLIDVRFTDEEVILARAGHKLKLSNVQEGTFAAQTQFTVPGAPAPYVEKRGWLSVDVKKGNDRFRFITTHLLPELLPAGIFFPIQVAQGAELITGPANTRLPVVLVCDCNSRADGTGTATYVNLLAAGFDDAWTEAHPHRPGFTCCQAEDLRNSPSAFDQRIDLVLIRGRARVEDVFRTGARERTKTDAGLWPSDHAGVVATFELR